MSIWDSMVASASRAVTQAATQAGEVTAVVATKAKLSADLLVIDRDITTRMERFGVDMYAHLEGITSTQEFYVADDRLINIIRPTLISAQREVAAYERKRDAMRGRVNLAEAERVGTGSIIYAATMGEKLMNAAKFAAAGAKEAANKTELAMLERQILGFKEEFGTKLYPIFAAMEDDEGWLPTDRKVRSLYDAAREDIAKMQSAKDEKREQIRRLDGGGAEDDGGFAPPPAVAENALTPTAVATPIGQTMPWASTLPPTSSASGGYGSSGYGIAQQQPIPPAYAQQQQQQQQHQPPIHNSGFGFMQTAAHQPSGGGNVAMPFASSASMPQYHGGGLAQQQRQQQQQYPPAAAPSGHHHHQQQPTAQQQPRSAMAAAFDPFDGIPGAGGPAASAPSWAVAAPPYKADAAALPSPDWFDSFSVGSSSNNNDAARNNNINAGGGTAGKQQSSLSDADMSLFKY